MARAAADGVALLVSLIPYVVAEGSVPVRDAAEHFDLPPERIRDAVERIFTSGVPTSWGDAEMFDIDSDAFYNDDVITLSYLPTLHGTMRLAPREVGAILAGLSLIGGLHDADAHRVAALTAKLRRASVDGPRSIAVDARPADTAAHTIRDAIAHRVVVELDYRKPGAATSTRRVAPTRLELRDGHAFAVGIDLDRDAERTFRLDRTEAVRLTATPYPDDVAQHRASPGALGGERRIVVDATPAAAAMLADYVDGEPSTHGDRVRVRIHAWDADAVLRHVASLGGDAVIVEPEPARAALAAFARDALRAYAASDGVTGADPLM